MIGDFHAEGMLPGICRMDYLFASRMKNGFERTKTLGDGDECCNCRYFSRGIAIGHRRKVSLTGSRYRHSMNAPDEMERLHKQFYCYLRDIGSGTCA